ncbi:hypothetical protein QJV43_gp40 [Serratia phage Serbin]|uniref:Uncharacterized protein n=1 Tax=Serratia phage Serbin TaxID=2562181 RepID=A0A482MHD9_9CAUD|nr:hypothetical protein QJV43_gp40 [Serratia phage Serbin]QBQ72956.1 hypothetical protein CPT_Serbin_040 [Serratia phage Serbin]
MKTTKTLTLYKLLVAVWGKYDETEIDAEEATSQALESAAWVLGGKPSSHSLESLAARFLGTEDLYWFLMYLGARKKLQENYSKNI